MSENNLDTLVFKTPISYDIIIAITIPTFFTILVKIFSDNALLVLLTSITVFIITTLCIILFKKTVIADSHGITISTKYSSVFVNWSDIRSISLHDIVNETLRYEILTNNGMKIVPYLSNHNQFEELFTKYGNLELSQTNGFPIESKRWKKKGKEYEYTSLSDHMNDMTFIGSKPLNK